ncbi:hypothetical protein FRX31_010084 [Thalictrum thalictroides]|uniref:Uncharacterized protein n=1 Tax=Thalictrum thalictroides TaxID=46969 RepID=A0A7J6WTQ3_THATH|nr:hypothetical protein FRX31_010084 [Thalictrum thalictroides]
MDRIIWLPSKSGRFSVSSAYRALSPEVPNIRWHSFVWNRMVIPRHAFSAWQLLSGGLPTQDNLMNRRMLNESSCILCSGHRENSKHLFFECSYSNEIWNHVKGLLEIKVDNINTNRLWMSIFKLCKGKSVVSAVFSTMICATVNFIWKERNARRFQVFQQELNAVHQGLLLARKLSVRQIEVASDSLRVIKVVNRIEAPPWDYQNQLHEIWDLVSGFQHIRCYHAFRETNRATDHLAALGVNQSLNVFYFISPMTKELCNIIEDDKNCKVYLRSNHYR